ncbi:hypothetical protein MP228_001754 [Amoeboaphelidium protococcarum]|nr:hypothetical protein MP228_001754 [Amoeboaphelidium protococcarum]
MPVSEMVVPSQSNSATCQTSLRSELRDQESHLNYAVFTGHADVLTPVPVVPADQEFIWSLKEEPHYSRRKEILKKYPQIQKLFGYDPTTKYVIVGIVALQLAFAWVFRDALSYQSVAFWLTAFAVGGACNQALFLAIHEMSHNLAFKSIAANKLFSSLVANIPISFPYAASFKPYHMDHHKYQGVEGIDTDLPTRVEALFFNSFIGKIAFVFFQILFYAVRPIFVKRQALTVYNLINAVWIFSFQAFLILYVGKGAAAYLLASTFFAGCGFHPCASHFIAEHYVFTGDWETYSYYGWLNIFCFNVGYHNEHHDFPNIPGSRLPLLRKIASEYYDQLPYHESWPLVTVKFIMDPNVSLFNRVKRQKKQVGGTTVKSD